jgi:hypothetical protein
MSDDALNLILCARPWLSAKARRLLDEHIEAMRAVGNHDDRLIAVAIEMLLEKEDRLRREIEAMERGR